MQIRRQMTTHQIKGKPNSTIKPELHIPTLKILQCCKGERAKAIMSIVLQTNLKRQRKKGTLLAFSTSHLMLLMPTKWHNLIFFRRSITGNLRHTFNTASGPWQYRNSLQRNNCQNTGQQLLKWKCRYKIFDEIFDFMCLRSRNFPDQCLKHSADLSVKLQLHTTYPVQWTAGTCRRLTSHCHTTRYKAHNSNFALQLQQPISLISLEELFCLLSFIDESWCDNTIWWRIRMQMIYKNVTSFRQRCC